MGLFNNKNKKENVSPTSQTSKTENRSRFVRYGYVVPDGKPIPAEYLVKVTSLRNKIQVIAPLPEEISLKVESSWSPVVTANLLGKANETIQVISGGAKSAVNKAISRRKWDGSSPISISITFSFQAITNPFKEVSEPCRILQSLSLPSEGLPLSSGDGSSMVGEVTGSVSSILPTLSPPGPSPYTLDGIFSDSRSSGEIEDSDLESVSSSVRGGDKILLELGRFLNFFNVIVKSVSMSVPTKYDNLGNPISAKVNVVFETYEMMTVESLQATYRKITTGNTGA